MNIDQKIPTALFLNNELTRYADKVSFIADQVMVDAMHYLEETGIPNAKHEDYKYCNVDAILKKEFKTIENVYSPIDIAQIQKINNIPNCICLFIVNGVFVEEISNLTNIPAGLTIAPIAKADKSLLQQHVSKYTNAGSDAFVALSALYAAHGVCIHLEKGKIINQPIHLIHLVSAKKNVFENLRNLIVVEKEASLHFIESFESIDLEGKVFTNYLNEIVVDEGASLVHTRVQNASKSSFQLNTNQVKQYKSSVYTNNTFTFNGAMVRNNLNVVMDDVNAEANLNGLFIAKGNQLVDNHTLVDHRKPHCVSNELYKGIVKDKATAVFNGKIFVRKDAQKTNAYQSSKNILLSDDGTVNTKPQLEIYADDVKCSHGTSTGKIDEEAVFYLKSRGVGEESAKLLLMHAFALEVLEKIENEDLSNHLEELINKNLKE